MTVGSGGCTLSDKSSLKTLETVSKYLNTSSQIILKINSQIGSGNYPPITTEYNVINPSSDLCDTNGNIIGCVVGQGQIHSKNVSKTVYYYDIDSSVEFTLPLYYTGLNVNDIIKIVTRPLYKDLSTSSIAGKVGLITAKIVSKDTVLHCNIISHNDVVVSSNSILSDTESGLVDICFMCKI